MKITKLSKDLEEQLPSDLRIIPEFLEDMKNGERRSNPISEH